MIKNKTYRGLALRKVAVTMLVLLLASGAGAQTNITSCTTISSPGEYVLNQSIMNSGASSCINITSSDVVFDGAGLTIDGIDGVNTNGVYVYNSSTALTNITVKNLNATDWQYGIHYNNITNGSITNNTVSSNTYSGISLDYSSGNMLSVNNASNNLNGIILFNSSNNMLSGNIAWNNANGINLLLSSNNTMSGSTAYLNSNIGIGLDYSGNNTLSGNSATNNYYGISLGYSNNNIISGNTANSNSIGISLSPSSDNNTLSGNNASNNNDGITLYFSNNNNLTGNIANSNNFNGGIYLASSNNNTLNGNNASNNSYGIFIASGSNNTLNGNIVNSNSAAGINLVWPNNILSGNNASNNSYGIYLTSSNNTLSGNTANSNSIYGIYLSSSTSSNNTLSGNTANSNNLAGIRLDSFSNMLSGNNVSNNGNGIRLEFSSNNTLSGNNANSNTGDGISLFVSSNNALNGNNASNNNPGIYLSTSSNNNTLSGNNVLNNTNGGITLASSSNNTIYNNYFNNTNNAIDNGNNYWNITKQPGTNIIGGSYLGGNFWSNYAGVDINGDGLGDTFIPYNNSGSIINGGDYLPLTQVQTVLFVQSSTGQGPVFFSTDAGTIENLTAVNVSNITEPPPAGVNLFYGLFRFNITGLAPGASANLTLMFPAPLPPNTTYWKFGANASNATPHWYNISSTINGSKLTITLTDGGVGDDDLALNGTIRDDSGPSLGTGEIHGMKWNDSNGNGIKNVGESGVANVTICVSGVNASCTVTNASGNYGFMNLTPGNYTVYEIVPPGKVQTSPPFSAPFYGIYNLTINSSEIKEGIDFGNANTSEIHGMKWNDSNGNGIKDINESGVSGVAIRLTRLIAPGVEFFAGNAFTNVSGNYSFIALPPGFYKVEENLSGRSQTFPANGSPHFINLSAGVVMDGIDFGNQPVPPGEIRGMKFNDSNGNGVQDVGELGVSGVSICIFPMWNCTTTDLNGNYSFQNVPAGTSTVFEGFISGRTATTSPMVTVTVNSSEVKIVNFGNRLLVPLPSDVSIVQQSGAQNGVPTVYRPGLTILTVRKNLTNISNNVVAVNLTLNWSDGTSKTVNMTQIDATNVWEANFSSPFSGGTAQMTFKVDVFPPGPGLEDAVQIGDIIFIDPSGQIQDACTGVPISGANVMLFVEFPPTTGNFIVSPAANQMPSDNPLTTGANGLYSWLTVPGTYMVMAEKIGFITNESPNVTVPPPAFNLNISLTPTGGCPPPSAGEGKVKGEGWIVSPIPPAKKDNKATFSFEAENKKGKLKGKLEYDDKAAGLKVEGNVTTLSINKAEKTATFSGFATIKTATATVKGTYTIMAWDNSKKGKENDRINITLSTGYTANATLGGGNIKVDP